MGSDKDFDERHLEESLEEIIGLLKAVNNQMSDELMPRKLTKIAPGTKDRLSDPYAYKILEMARSKQDEFYAALRDGRPDMTEEAIRYNMFPVVGLAINIFWEYVNDKIDKDELCRFSRSLSEGIADDFLRRHGLDWKEHIENTFFIPASHKSLGKMHFPIFSDHPQIEKAYDQIMGHYKPRYCRDADDML